jgi:LmbE family N-acetylglucosaminyl deacetylase
MILCLGAHPDDIELGLGGYLAQSKKQRVGVTFTCQSAFRHLLPEMLTSWNLLDLNFDHNNLQDFKHREFNRQNLLDSLIELREKYKPEIVFTHSSFDTHQDHKIVHEETVRAFKKTTILGYQLPWNDLNGSKYTYYKKIGPAAFNCKLEALKCYESQKERTYFTDEYQEAILMVNGIECGEKMAEKFEVIRYIE